MAEILQGICSSFQGRQFIEVGTLDIEAAEVAKRAIENPLQLRIAKGFQVDFVINF